MWWAGFQGVDEGGNITTLGRGGSDTTAVALAAALKADECQIYTDVDGVYTQIPMINELVERVTVSRDKITVQLDRNNLIRRITGIKENGKESRATATHPIELTIRVKLRRSGIESKLVYPAGKQPQVHSRSIKALQEALLKSLRWNDDLVSGNIRSIDALIQRDNLNPRQVHRLRKLAFLAPDIMDRIIAGDIPDTLTLERLKKDFPIDWKAQRSHFGLSQLPH